MANWVEGKVVENIHWTDDLFTLKVEAEVDGFQAGQFTSLALDLKTDTDATIERIARPYSYLNAPGVKPLEFFFYKALDGALSTAMFDLEPGDNIWIKKQSNGFFVLDEVPAAKDLWLIGTGTGIAPFLSILNSAEVWSKFENVILVHGIRSESDLRYQDEIQLLLQQNTNRLSYQAFVSREDVPGTIRARIPAAINDGSLEQAVGRTFSLADSQIMLCGNPGMVKDAVELLKDKGFKKNLRRKPGQITTENYW